MLQISPVSLIIWFATVISISLLPACGGGDSGDDQTIDAKLAITAADPVQKKAIALSPIGQTMQFSLYQKAINFFLASAIAEGSDQEMVGISQSDQVEPMYSEPVPVEDYAMPSEARQGDQYLVSSGVFSNLRRADGSVITCNLLVSKFGGDGTVLCVHQLANDELPGIPVAVIRDGDADRYLEDTDSVYFAVNKAAGGGAIFKYQNGQTTLVAQTSTGKVTNLLQGTKGIFGYDVSAASNIIVFGNDKRGFDILTDLLDRPLAYRGFVLFPFREFTDDSGTIRNQSVFFSLNDVSSTTFGDEWSIRCKTPEALSKTAVHSYGVVWISRDKGELCEAFESTNRPEPILYRFLDTSGIWSQAAISNDVFAGVVTINGAQRLVIDPVASGPRDLGSQRAIDMTDDLIAADLDVVARLARYVHGFIIEGQKHGQFAVRYLDTTDGVGTFTTLSEPPAELGAYLEVAH